MNELEAAGGWGSFMIQGLIDTVNNPSIPKEIREYYRKEVVRLGGEYRMVYPHLQCECCKEVSDDVVVYHQRTFYEDNESNYVALCPPCKRDNDQYWDEMWLNSVYGDGL